MSALNLLSQRREALTTVMRAFCTKLGNTDVPKVTNILFRRLLYKLNSKMKEAEANAMSLIS